MAAPSSYHDFTGPEPLAYDVPGTDKGNEWKITKVSLSLSGPPLSANKNEERDREKRKEERGGNEV